MVNEIFKAAAIPYRRGRYTGAKPATYAVYMDDLTTDGADTAPLIVIRHDITIELYEDKPDDKAEAALEIAISARGLQWVKQDRLWLQTEQLYQVIYEFSYFEKRRA